VIPIERLSFTSWRGGGRMCRRHFTFLVLYMLIDLSRWNKVDTFDFLNVNRQFRFTIKDESGKIFGVHVLESRKA
jgi:hypothetical protein